MVYGRVYSIRSHQTSDIYIGSTTQILCKRLSDHRGGYKYYLRNGKRYMSSYEIIQFVDNYIELIFEGEFESVDSLTKKEGEYIREMNCVNKNVAGRTQQEYYAENKERILDREKKYRADNALKIAGHKHEYYVDNKEKIAEKGKQWRGNNKEKVIEKSKKYYEYNKDEILEYQHQYYKENQDAVKERVKKYREENLEQIHKRREQTYKCECGSTNCIENKERHERSIQHQNYVNSLGEHKQDVVKVPKFSCKCGAVCNINDKKRHERSKKHQLFIQSLSAV